MHQMTYEEKQDLRAAAFKAQRVYPGPVGALIYREIQDWVEFGYRFGNASLIRQLRDAVMEHPDPE
jgi:hypothetical protein